MIIPTLEDRSCVAPIFYSLPATKLAKGMSTEDGQDVLTVDVDDDGSVFARVYTPRSDDPEQDEENRHDTDMRMYDPGERVGLAVFRDTARHALADPDAVIAPPMPDHDEPIHAWPDAEGVWHARVTLRPEVTPDALRADADRLRLRAVEAVRCEIGLELSPFRDVEPVGTDERDGYVVAVTYRAVARRAATGPQH